MIGDLVEQDLTLFSFNRFWWSPTGKARGTLLHAPVGRHLPTDVGTHSSTAKGRGLLLPG